MIRALIRRTIWLILFTCSGCTPSFKPPGMAQTTPVLAKAHFLTSDRAVLPLRSWLPTAKPPQAALIALHGFNDYSRFFETPGRYLSQHGIACYAYDQRGFGHAPNRGYWPGVSAYVQDLFDVVSEVRRKHPGIPIYVLGESMGAAVTMVAMTEQKELPIEGAILASPAVWSRDTMPWYQRWLLATSAHTVPWLRLTGEGLHILASDNIEMLRELGRDPRVIKATRVDTVYGLTDLMDLAQLRARHIHTETLVLYGEKDQVVPKKPVYRMLAAMASAPRIRTAIYPHGHHLLLRDLKAEQAWADIATWIEDPKRPLPSRADRNIRNGSQRQVAIRHDTRFPIGNSENEKAAE
jgi:alpha-beta hydrolase superfamily lysophospholipase